MSIHRDCRRNGVVCRAIIRVDQSHCAKKNAERIVSGYGYVVRPSLSVPLDYTVVNNTNRGQVDLFPIAEVYHSTGTLLDFQSIRRISYRN